MRFRVAGLLLAAFVSAGCSLEYGDARVAERVPDSLPTASIRGFSHTVVRQGRTQFKVTSDRALRYDNDEEQHLFDVEFEEVDADGEVVARGGADFARYFDDSEDVEMVGDIEFYSEVENARVIASYLFWNREERLLLGDREDLVRVEQEDGTSLQGYGFHSNMRTRELGFEREVSGRYVERRDSEASGQESQP
ncbi:MAG: LPS export ABC transporter periplasmic protein LptC [Spirochaetales bacterium]